LEAARPRLGGRLGPRGWRGLLLPLRPGGRLFRPFPSLWPCGPVQPGSCRRLLGHDDRIPEEGDVRRRGRLSLGFRGDGVVVGPGWSGSKAEGQRQEKAEVRGLLGRRLHGHRVPLDVGGLCLSRRVAPRRGRKALPAILPMRKQARVQDQEIKGAPAGSSCRRAGKGVAWGGGYFTSLKPAESTSEPSLPDSAGTQQTRGWAGPEKQTWQFGRPSGMVMRRRYAMFGMMPLL